jgi:hypothetical protein
MFCILVGMLARFGFPDPAPAPLIYRQFFTADEIRDLDAAALTGAVSEIAMLRVLIARVMAAVRRKTGLSLESRLAMLVAFCHAAATVASLARLESRRREPPPSPLELMMAAIADQPL